MSATNSGGRNGEKNTSAQTLISHRYLPEKSHEPGNPVFSVYQADVIYYGADLIDYFEREFAGW
jgi:hypothetical protein